LNEEYKLSTHTILSENNNQSDIKNSNIISWSMLFIFYQFLIFSYS
jgi:hypothetical protein